MQSILRNKTNLRLRDEILNNRRATNYPLRLILLSKGSTKIEASSQSVISKGQNEVTNFIIIPKAGSVYFTPANNVSNKILDLLFMITFFKVSWLISFWHLTSEAAENFCRWSSVKFRPRNLFSRVTKDNCSIICQYYVNYIETFQIIGLLTTWITT